MLQFLSHYLTISKWKNSRLSNGWQTVLDAISHGHQPFAAGIADIGIAETK